jgi:hypothetical protein
MNYDPLHFCFNRGVSGSHTALFFGPLGSSDGIHRALSSYNPLDSCHIGCHYDSHHNKWFICSFSMFY